MRFLLALLVVGVVSSVSAADGIRDGANHHLGDDSFLAAYGRLPSKGDSEALRMHVHLAYVRELLAARAATTPALAGRRAELLGYHLIGRERWDSTGEPKPEECAATATAVPAKRAAKLTTMLASRKVLHAPIPVWSIEPRPDADADAATPAPTAGEDPAPAVADNPLDMTTMLADHMTWYMEWPHIDGTFVAVYETVPGYTTTPNY